MTGPRASPMAEVRYFDAINLPSFPREAVYRRLGYRRGKTVLTPRQGEETEKAVARALSLITLKGAVTRLPVAFAGEETIRLPGGHVFISRRLRRFLAGAEEICLMGATAGAEIGAAIREEQEAGRLAVAVVLDAVASETVDAALDWIGAYVAAQVRREGKRVMKGRFSAGYGDFYLENQTLIHELLGLERLGVGVNEACVLVPEKSVTAVAGIAGGVEEETVR